MSCMCIYEVRITFTVFNLLTNFKKYKLSITFNPSWRVKMLPAWLYSVVIQRIETKIFSHKFRIQKEIFGKCWKWFWKRRTLLKIHSRLWKFMDRRFFHGIQWQHLPEEASAWWECRYKIKTHVLYFITTKKLKTHEDIICLRAQINGTSSALMQIL